MVASRAVLRIGRANSNRESGRRVRVRPRLSWPVGSGALGIVGAGLERPVPAAALHEQLAADGARLVQHLRPFTHFAVLADVGTVLAFRIARARDERPEAAGPLDELTLAT